MNYLRRLIKEEIKKVLLEVTMEQAEARFNSKSFRKAMIEVNEILGYKLPAELELLKSSCIRNIKGSISNDIPVRFKADALWWAISTFIKTGKFGRTTDRTKAIETFFQIKEAGKGSILSQQDINQIQSWDELEEVVTQAKPAWEEYKEKRDQTSFVENIKNNQDLIYEDDDWWVFVPKSWESSCELGKDSGWCTSSPNDPSSFRNYYKPEDPLIFFINKRNPKDRYQLHYGKEEFKKRKNKNIEKPIFYKLNKIVKSLDDKLPEKVIKAANAYDFEELPGGGYKISDRHGVKYYNEAGELHRLDGPAVEEPDGFEQWYKNDKLHRLDGPAIIRPDGSEWWFRNNKRHRQDGPAIKLSNGHEEWYHLGKPHRLDGPAIREKDGTEYWFIKGKKYSEQDFNQKVKELEAQQNLREYFKRFM